MRDPTSYRDRVKNAEHLVALVHAALRAHRHPVALEALRDASDELSQAADELQESGLLPEEEDPFRAELRC